MESLKSVEKCIIPESNILYFFFGGIQSGIAMPPFEFYQASGILNENKIFLRDFSQTWYHSGLEGISECIDTTSLYIEKIISDLHPEKLYFVGNSMGGYAAILFSVMIGWGEALSFAPQTFLSSNLRNIYRDRRWPEQISKTLFLSATRPEAHDLQKYLLAKKYDSNISVFVARDDRLDYIHAQHIKSCPRVNIYEFHAGGHGLVRKLRDAGKLPQIMAGKYVYP